MNFNGNDPSLGDSAGSFKIPCCKVVDPVTGQPVIVPATDPPQGEVFYVDCPPPPFNSSNQQTLGTHASAPLPMPFGPALFAALPVPFGSNVFAPSPLPFGSNEYCHPYSYNSTSDQYEFGNPPQGSSYPYRGASPFNDYVYGNAGEYTQQPLDGPWNSTNSNFFRGIRNLHEEARNEFKQNSLSIQPQESFSVAPATDGSIPTPSMSSKEAQPLASETAETAAPSTSAEPLDASLATNDPPTPASSSSTGTQPSTSSQGSSSSEQNEAKSVNPEDLCDEGGPRDLHTQQKISSKYCRGLLQAKTSGTKPWVTRILVDRSRATFYFDTMEELTVSADNINIGRLMACSHASYSMTLECSALRTKLLFIDQEVLRRFFAYTISLTVTGFLGVENLEWLMQVIKVSTLNIHQWRVSHVGRLGSLTHVGLPPQIQHLYFDARGTDNPTFVDSISRLYMDTYVKDHGKNSFLQSLTLVVVDFCALGQALVAQLQRLNMMLSYTEPSSAAVITTQMADDDILRELQALGFRYSHAGFIEELDGPMMKIHYWKKTAGQKSVILGFKARKYLSRTKEEIDIIKNL